MAQTKQVFVSYGQEDTQFAHLLAEDLRRLGVKVWIAPESIRPGESWVDAINRGLQESSHMVVVLTPTAIKSPWVNMETNVAIALERKGQIQLIPLEVEPCEPPPLWSSYQMIAFRHDYQTGLSHLSANLGLRRAAYKPQRPNESQVLARIKAIVAEKLGVDEQGIRPDSDIIDDLGADALDLIELVMAIEEEWDIEIPDEEVDFDNLRLRRVSQWVSYVATRAHE